MVPVNDKDPSSRLATAISDAIRQAVREELDAFRSRSTEPDGDRLLDAEGAARVLSVSPAWIYRNGRSKM